MVTAVALNTREVLLSSLAAARAETDALFQIVKAEAMYDRPIPERHRIVFYVGHLEAFDWNLLGGGDGPRKEFDRLFAFGIDPVGGNLPTDNPSDWPSLGVVYDYRDQTRAAVDRVLDAGDIDETKIHVAIEHRLMHAETLAYILHQLPFDRKQIGDIRSAAVADAGSPALVQIPEGEATLGLRRDSGVFGWDNEFEEETVHVPPFAIDKYKITNGQYLQFLHAGGYENASLWKPADWEWRTAQSISHPVFWIRRGDSWKYRAMFEEIVLPPDQPVYVSHAEASAYANWAGKALPTEPQWQRTAHGNYGLEQTIAAGWEWTSTEFGPLPGFHAEPFYPGYSEPFFDGKHYVLKGGSPSTAPVMLRPSFRNWFQPHYQYVYAGFRCVEREG